MTPTHLMTTIDHPVSTSTLTSISFRVDDVEQVNKRLGTIPFRESIVKGIGKKAPSKDVSMSLMHSMAEEPYHVLGISSEMSVTGDKGNVLLGAVHMAFDNHLALTLSPDVIWQTILQGVAQHIAEYPEQYRHLMVKHEGKATLILTRSDLSLGDLDAIGRATPSIVDDFMELLGSEVTSAYMEVLQQGFSTTGRAEQVAAAITCMDAFSPYFDYLMMCGCGFPKITLNGTVEDWRKLKVKIGQIEELFHLDEQVNLTWWTSKLNQIADHFILAAQGNPDIAWWKKMYKQIDAYMHYQFNGWIGWLWPYTKNHDIWNEEKMVWEKSVRVWQRNPMLDNISDDVTVIKNVHSRWNYSTDGKGNRLPEEHVPFTFGDANQRKLSSWGFSESIRGSHFMRTDDFPGALSKVSLKISDAKLKQTLDTFLVGGVVGITQDDEGGITPQIGYALLA